MRISCNALIYLLDLSFSLIFAASIAASREKNWAKNVIFNLKSYFRSGNLKDFRKPKRTSFITFLKPFLRGRRINIIKSLLGYRLGTTRRQSFSTRRERQPNGGVVSDPLSRKVGQLYLSVNSFSCKDRFMVLILDQLAFFKLIYIVLQCLNSSTFFLA